MRRALVILMLVCSRSGFADSPDPGVGSDVAPPEAPPPQTPAQTTPSPWVDLSPSKVIAPPVTYEQPEPVLQHNIAAPLTLGGMYVVFAGWMYVAWYQHHRDLAQYKFGGDDEPCKESGLGRWFSRCALIGWAGDETYAGGEDKFGHAWSTMSLARLGTEILTQWGHYDRTDSMLIATAASELIFAGVEVRDGFNFEFSYSDLGGDTVGALAALALMRWPRLDELVDFRVQYFPSQMYLRKLDGSSPCPYGGCSRWNIAEDYSGQTYLLAFHLGAIHSLRDMEYGTISRFVDVTLGYDTRNYKPTPDADITAKPTQSMFVGVSFNAQGFFDWLLEGRPSSSAHTLRKITHGLFEVFNLPFTSLPILEHDHSPSGPPVIDGA